MNSEAAITFMFGEDRHHIEETALKYLEESVMIEDCGDVYGSHYDSISRFELGFLHLSFNGVDEKERFVRRIRMDTDNILCIERARPRKTNIFPGSRQVDEDNFLHYDDQTENAAIDLNELALVLHAVPVVQTLRKCFVERALEVLPIGAFVDNHPEHELDATELEEWKKRNFDQVELKNRDGGDSEMVKRLQQLLKGNDCVEWNFPPASQIWGRADVIVNGLEKIDNS